MERCHAISLPQSCAKILPGILRESWPFNFVKYRQSTTFITDKEKPLYEHQYTSSFYVYINVYVYMYTVVFIYISLCVCINMHIRVYIHVSFHESAIWRRSYKRGYPAAYAPNKAFFLEKCYSAICC